MFKQHFLSTVYTFVCFLAITPIAIASGKIFRLDNGDKIREAYSKHQINAYTVNIERSLFGTISGDASKILSVELILPVTDNPWSASFSAGALGNQNDNVGVLSHLALRIST